VGLEALRTLGRRDFVGKDPGNLLVPQAIFYQHPCIPVMMELRQFDKPDINIKAVIAEELETCGFPHPEDLTELFLKNGKLLVLLDGLDEAPSATLNHAITEIENLVDRHSDNRYIASCRVAAYTFGGFRRFKDVAMAAFEDEQIQQFIKNWFQKDRDLEVGTADRCWELLNSNDYRAAKELAQTPLLLTLLCVVYDEFQDFPKKRHALYGEALDVLLRKWASEKRIQRNPIYQELSAELELDMLAEIAYTSFADGQLFFAKDRLVQQIREFLVENLNAPSHLDAETVLKEIEVQQGILVERARDTYSFSHLTFHEYLTAKCIVDNQKTAQLVRDHLTEQHWREVFLLVAGLAPGKCGANFLLESMEKQAQTYLINTQLSIIIEWATQATQNSPRQSAPAAKRAAAVFLTVLLIAPDYASGLDYARAITVSFDRALNRALDLALDIAHTHARARAIAIATAEEYQKLEIFEASLIDNLLKDLINLEDEAPTLHSSLEFRHQFGQKIIASFSKNLNIELGFFHINSQDIERLGGYFYTLDLMVRCKEAAVRVSPQVWADIESRMVTVPE
jgi:hypothetical protein